MEITQDQLKAHLMQSDEQFRQLVSQHAEFKRRVEELEAKPRLTPEEQMEESKLKKLKLRLKDQMAEIMCRHKAEHVV